MCIGNVVSLGKGQTSKRNTHYEKLRPSKPHYLATKAQKTTHIQLLCNYLLGIQLMCNYLPRNMVY